MLYILTVLNSNSFDLNKMKTIFITRPNVFVGGLCWDVLLQAFLFNFLLHLHWCLGLDPSLGPQWQYFPHPLCLHLLASPWWECVRWLQQRPFLQPSYLKLLPQERASYWASPAYGIWQGERIYRLLTELWHYERYSQFSKTYVLYIKQSNFQSSLVSSVFLTDTDSGLSSDGLEKATNMSGKKQKKKMHNPFKKNIYLCIKTETKRAYFNRLTTY